MTDDLRHVRDAGDGLALGLCGGGLRRAKPRDRAIRVELVNVKALVAALVVIRRT